MADEKAAFVQTGQACHPILQKLAQALVITTDPNERINKGQDDKKRQEPQHRLKLQKKRVPLQVVVDKKKDPEHKKNKACDAMQTPCMKGRNQAGDDCYDADCVA